MSPTIYLFGYSGQNRDAFEAWVERENAVVLDIRFSARSRVPRWSKEALSACFGNIADGSSRYNPPRYLPVPEFGNVNYNRDAPICIADFAGGRAQLRQVEMQGYAAIVLLCVCRHAGCHRYQIAEKLRALGYRIEEVRL
jgi:hypothetical protein